MDIVYYVIDSASGAPLRADIRTAERSDYLKTVQEHWQTKWMSKFIQQQSLQKYALKVAATGELVGLGAYRDMPEGVIVYVEYIESVPHSNPAQTGRLKR